MHDIIDTIKNLFLSNIIDFVELIVLGTLFTIIEKHSKPIEKLKKTFKDDIKIEIINALINIFIFIPLIVLISESFVDIILEPLISKQLFAEQIQSLPIVIQIILGAIILDFATYWRHRFTHYYMWSYHSMHHSAKQISWITGFRLHPVDLLAAMLFTSFILYFLGFSGVGFWGAIIINRLMNYITHMNCNLKFNKPLRYIIASPHYHRWHHATKKEAYNTNFCGSFPFLDLLFGSYYHPEELPDKYGLSPIEQKNFPEKSYIGWLTYPFKRTKKLLMKKLNKIQS